MGTKTLRCCHNNWLHPVKTHYLFPGGYRKLVYLVVHEYECEPGEHKRYAWQGLLKEDGSLSKLRKIHHDDWMRLWVPRIHKETITDWKSLTYKQIDLKVSEFSQKVHRGADSAIGYLKKVGSL